MKTSISLQSVWYTHFELSLGADGKGRQPRFIRHELQRVYNQLDRGKDLVYRTYLKQLWHNWQINYEFVYQNVYLEMFNKTKTKEQL